ncbi:SLAP domain-containing protein [Bacillus solitudinis]|uniref:SLAP domain-containing protein n=1 Tax=Bacillus solitudinis TaxID=2014074 RepID=UPI000C23E0E4|nr:SLAP domain-containing protein [Bacillus solitudinis]
MAISRKENKQHAQQTLVSAKALLGQDNVDSSEPLKKHSLVDTPLSIPGNWNLSKEDHYALQFILQDAPELHENDIGLCGVSATPTSLGGYEVSAIVRNGSGKSISFSETSLVLLDKQGVVIARKLFHLEGLGVLPAFTSRPWTFAFEANDVTQQLESVKGWSLVFDLSAERKYHQLDPRGDWSKHHSAYTVNLLLTAALKVSAPPFGKIRFHSLNVSKEENGLLLVTILIQNGNEHTLQLEQVPVELKAPDGTTITRSSFELDSLHVPPYTSKLITLLFTADMYDYDGEMQATVPLS